MKVKIELDLDQEMLHALDYHLDAPVGMQVVRSDIPGCLKGILEVALGDVLIEYRRAILRNLSSVTPESR